MSRREITMHTTREIDGAFAVIAQRKSFGSMGPDPGRVESESTVVEGVSREYADMLERELVKHDFDVRWSGEKNIFTAAFNVSRRIDMLASDNPHFAESVSNPLAF